MELPGGLCDGAASGARDWAFLPLTGETELELDAARRSPASTPERVTGILGAVLSHIGGDKVSLKDVRALSVADRQFLMVRLAAELGLAEGWYSHSCGECAESFDFSLDLTSLPVREAGQGYPLAHVELGARSRFVFHVPTGGDQEVLANESDPEVALRKLLKRCLEPGQALPANLSAPDIERIDSALEAVAPVVERTVEGKCPNCGALNQILIDLYEPIDDFQSELLWDVHRLARAYHWSEAEISALPLARRRAYLELVERDQKGTG